MIKLPCNLTEVAILDCIKGQFLVMWSCTDTGLLPLPHTELASPESLTEI